MSEESEIDMIPCDKFNDLTMLSSELLDRSEELIAKGKILVEAARSGDLNLVVNLVEQGISVNAEEYNRSLFYASHNYVTPLQAACLTNQLACAKYLIEHDADVNCKDKFDVTAVHVAAENGHLGPLRALLEAGAACSVPTKYSKRGCYTAVPHCGGTTPLHLAAIGNHVKCVVELIQFGADFNAVDEKGRTSLYWAAFLGFSDCILAHIQHAIGRDILSLPDYETGDTPLHFAVQKGLVDCVRELLRVGSDPNHLNRCGMSPLHYSVHPAFSGVDGKSKEIMKLLVLKGHNVDINQEDSFGYSPLHYVAFTTGPCFARRPNWAVFLIRYGADPLIQNKRKGCSLIEYEIRSAQKESSLLNTIVQSLGELPDMRTLQITASEVPPTLMPFHDPMFPYFMTGYEENEPRQNVMQQRAQEKLKAYNDMAFQPRALQHYCRCSIRRALGSRRMRHITNLQLPTGVQKYLLLKTSKI